MLSPNSDSYTLSFPIWISFISFSSPIAMTRTSKTVLNKSGESGHLCLVLDLGGDTFSFSLLSLMLTVGLSYYGLYPTEIGSLCAHFPESFYHRWIKTFSASIEVVIGVLFFSLLVWSVTLIDLQILKNLCIPRIYPT